MPEKYHRIHVRLSKKEYERLKKKSAKACLPMNKYVVRQLETAKPIDIPWKEALEFIALLNEAGRDINDVAHAFNAGMGTREQLRFAVKRMSDIVENGAHVAELKKRLNTPQSNEDLRK